MIAHSKLLVAIMYFQIIPLPFIDMYIYISMKSRLRSLSSSEEIFNDSVTPYQDALDKSGYKHKLKYEANIDTANNKKQNMSFGSTHRTAKT